MRRRPFSYIALPQRTQFYTKRRINLPKRSREIELDYVNHIRETIGESIRKHSVDRVAEILSNDRIVVKKSRISLVESNYLYILDRPAVQYQPVPHVVSTTNQQPIVQSSPPPANRLETVNNTEQTCRDCKRKRDEGAQATTSSVSLKSSNSVKRVKKFKSLRFINWCKFYVDEFKKDNALHYAARLGKTFLIDVILRSKHFDVNEPNRLDLDSALTLACDSGHVDTVLTLIKHGANVNQENARFKTPLIIATELKDPLDVQLCKILLNSGALVNKVTFDTNTALLSASKYGNLDLVRLLVSANANLRFQQADGSTALMRACYFNHYDLAAYLIERHVEIEACNVRRETALYIAAFRGHTRLVEMLVNAHGARVNSQDLDGDTPLSVACYENRPETIRALLAHGARVDVHGIRGDTPLHVAVCNCSAEVVEWLCLRGANADAVNNNNETPLHLAAQDSNVIIVKTLLNRARSLDQCTRFENKTVFRLLVEQADVFKIKMAMCVVKAGCDVNMSFNTENACNFSSSSSNITILSNHNHRNIWHDSPFDYLFKMPRVNFKKEDNIEQVDDKDSIYLLINFIELVLRAGFKLSPSDYEHFKASWLHEYLKEQDPVGLRNLDSLFTMCSTRPARLLDMCKFKIRQRLVKPLFPSIDKLNIPLDLKEFLFLER